MVIQIFLLKLSLTLTVAAYRAIGVQHPPLVKGVSKASTEPYVSSGLYHSLVGFELTHLTPCQDYPWQ